MVDDSRLYGAFARGIFPGTSGAQLTDRDGRLGCLNTGMYYTKIGVDRRRRGVGVYIG